MNTLQLWVSSAAISSAFALWECRSKRRKGDLYVFVALAAVFWVLAAYALYSLGAGHVPAPGENNDLLSAGQRYETLSDTVVGSKDHLEFIKRPDGTIVSYHTSDALPKVFIFTPGGVIRYTPVK